MRIEKIPRITEQAQKGCFEARLIEIAWHGLRHIREMYWAAFAAIDGEEVPREEAPYPLAALVGRDGRALFTRFILRLYMVLWL